MVGESRDGHACLDVGAPIAHVRPYMDRFAIHLRLKENTAGRRLAFDKTAVCSISAKTSLALGGFSISERIIISANPKSCPISL